MVMAGSGIGGVLLTDVGATWAEGSFANDFSGNFNM